MHPHVHLARFASGIAVCRAIPLRRDLDKPTRREVLRGLSRYLSPPFVARRPPKRPSRSTFRPRSCAPRSFPLNGGWSRRSPAGGESPALNRRAFPPATLYKCGRRSAGEALMLCTVHRVKRSVFPPVSSESETEMAEQEYHKKGEASSKDKTSDEEAEVRKNEMLCDSNHDKRHLEQTKHYLWHIPCICNKIPSVLFPCLRYCISIVR